MGTAASPTSTSASGTVANESPQRVEAGRAHDAPRKEPGQEQEQDAQPPQIGDYAVAGGQPVDSRTAACLARCRRQSRAP